MVAAAGAQVCQVGLCVALVFATQCVGEGHVLNQASFCDTVIATLATLAAAGLSLREAMPLANKAGGVVVGKFGTATVSFEELFA